MKKNKKMSSSLSYERLFKVTQKNYTIDLSGSLSVIDNKASEMYFQNEVFELSFCTDFSCKHRFYNVLTSANECFSLKDLSCLKEQLGITLTGYGMCFTVVDFEYNFTIQIDKVNSLFIDTPSVKNGLIHFTKNALEIA